MPALADVLIMSIKLVSPLILVTASLAIGCQDADPDGDAARLEQFRAAIPDSADLEAPRANGTEQLALGDAAQYPRTAAPVAEAINGSVIQMMGLLETVIALPPTSFDAGSDQFVWGPMPSDDGVGFVAATIRDAGADAELRYRFAFLRGGAGDLATMTPIISGGATPDPEGENRGLILWDFEADRDVRAQIDPAYDPAAGHRGRFATVFGSGASASGAERFTFVVAAFRDFVAADNPTAAPADLDYLYGRVERATEVVDFFDFETAIDIDSPADGVAENVGVRMAFIDQGLGRAEARAAGGSMTADQAASVVECWEGTLTQTFLAYQMTDQGQVTESGSEGDSFDCGVFEAGLDALEIPSLATVDPQLLAALDRLASTGSLD